MAASTRPLSFRPVILVLGDVIAFALVTLAGFYRHGELQGQTLLRMLATFVPFTIAWLLFAPWLGLYSPTVVKDTRSLWRPALAAVLSAPLGAVLRGVWLAAPVLTVFVGVMAGVTAVVLTAWRAAFLIFDRR